MLICKFDNFRGVFCFLSPSLLLLVDYLLLVVDCALFNAVVCGQQCYIYILLLLLFIYFFFITLQEKIDTVTVEGVENVGEEDCIKIKTEEDYIQLVRTVMGKEEVSVLCSKL